MSDFLKDLPGSLRDSPELSKFKSVEDLASSFIEASKSLSQRIVPIGGEDDDNVIFDKSSKFFDIPKNKEDYKSAVEKNTEALNELGHKYKIHPKQLAPLAKGMREILSKDLEVKEKSKLEEFKKETQTIENENSNIDILRAKAVEKLGTTVDKLKAELGSSYYQPAVQKMLVNLGKESGDMPYQRGNAPKTTDTGGGSTENPKTPQQKLDYLYLYRGRVGGPYFDKDYPGHAQIKKNCDQFMEDLKKYEKDTGEKVEIPIPY